MPLSTATVIKLLKHIQRMCDKCFCGAGHANATDTLAAQIVGWVQSQVYSSDASASAYLQ